MLRTSKLTRNVLVAAKRGDDSGLISENDFVFGAGREETLEKGDSRVKDDSALDASLNADLHLAVVDEVGTDTLNIGGGGTVEVGGAEKGAKAVGFDLNKKESTMKPRIISRGKM